MGKEELCQYCSRNHGCQRPAGKREREKKKSERCVRTRVQVDFLKKQKHFELKIKKSTRQGFNELNSGYVQNYFTTIKTNRLFAHPV